MSTRKRKTKPGSRQLQRQRGKRKWNSAEEFLREPNPVQENWTSTLETISLMRTRGISLSQASRESGIAVSTVVRLGGSALTKHGNGRYAAKSADRLFRVVVVPTGDGLREIGVRDSREASLIGKYWAAVQKYLETGDATALRGIRRKQITDASGASVPLIKDLAELDRLGSAGVLSFESLYAKSA
jgi:hypothetical protein